MIIKNKYHNTKVIYNGIKFDSKKERDRYIQLKQLHSLGQIESLELQPKFLFYLLYEFLEDKIVNSITFNR